MARAGAKFLQQIQKMSDTCIISEYGKYHTISSVSKIFKFLQISEMTHVHIISEYGKYHDIQKRF